MRPLLAQKGTVSSQKSNLNANQAKGLLVNAPNQYLSQVQPEKILGTQYSKDKNNPNNLVREMELMEEVMRSPGLGYQINSTFERPSYELKFPSPYIKYKIVPLLNEKKCLDVTTINSESKNLRKHNTILWDYHGGPNQQFYIKESQAYPDKYYIINVSKGFTLQVPDSSTKEGTQLLVNPRNDTPNELWDLRVAQNSFYIASFNGLVLDVCEKQTSNGTAVVQWPFNGGKNQKWRIAPA